MHFPYFLGLLHSNPRQLYDCPSACEVILNDMGKINLYQTTTKHNKAWIVCIFLGMYRIKLTTHCGILITIISAVVIQVTDPLRHLTDAILAHKLLFRTVMIGRHTHLSAITDLKVLSGRTGALDRISWGWMTDVATTTVVPLTGICTYDVEKYMKFSHLFSLQMLFCFEEVNTLFLAFCIIPQHLTYWDRHNGQHFTEHIFTCIFFNENVSILIYISLKFVPKSPILSSELMSLSKASYLIWANGRCSGSCGDHHLILD